MDNSRDILVISKIHGNQKNVTLLKVLQTEVAMVMVLKVLLKMEAMIPKVLLQTQVAMVLKVLQTEEDSNKLVEVHQVEIQTKLKVQIQVHQVVKVQIKVHQVGIQTPLQIQVVERSKIHST
jgi:hypothetical protein